jgi:DNA invertase Pin-like site-specific DNA recombinase
MFQMLGVFAEFERAMIQERVRAGLARARAQGTKSGNPIGRPSIAETLVERIREARSRGLSVRATAEKFGVSPVTVQKVSGGPFVDAVSAAVAS